MPINCCATYTGVSELTVWRVSDGKELTRVTKIKSDGTTDIVFLDPLTGAIVTPGLPYTTEKETAKVVKFITVVSGATKGSFKEAIEQTDLKTGTVKLFVNGTIYTTAANEVVADFVTRLNLGTSTVTVNALATAFSIPTIPANSRYARGQVQGGTVQWSGNGETVTGTGANLRETPSGGFIILTTAEEIANFRVAAAQTSGTPNITIDFDFQNIESEGNT